MEEKITRINVKAGEPITIALPGGEKITIEVDDINLVWSRTVVAIKAPQDFLVYRTKN